MDVSSNFELTRAHPCLKGISNNYISFIHSACSLSVMLAIGNTLSNSVYEATIRNGSAKPGPNSSREEKEKWIRCKYESKEFLPESNRSVPNGQQLVEAVVRFVSSSFIIHSAIS